MKQTQENKYDCEYFGVDYFDCKLQMEAGPSISKIEKIVNVIFTLFNIITLKKTEYNNVSFYLWVFTWKVNGILNRSWMEPIIATYYGPHGSVHYCYDERAMRAFILKTINDYKEH